MDANDVKLSMLKAFFSTEENPVSATEMTHFWNSLSDEEKLEFKQQFVEITG